MELIYSLVVLMVFTGLIVTGLAQSFNAPLKHITWIFPILGIVPYLVLCWVDSGKESAIAAVGVIIVDVAYPFYLLSRNRITGAMLACLAQAFFAFFYAVFVSSPP